MEENKLNKSIEPILKITKNVIKKSEHFNNYYINKNNMLYNKQLPLLMRSYKSKRKGIYNYTELERIEGKNTLINEKSDSKDINNNSKINMINTGISNIRKSKNRSIDLPALCPFFNKSGDLLSEVVKSSRINDQHQKDSFKNINITNSYNYNNSILNSCPKKRVFGKLFPLNKKLRHREYFKLLAINFDELQKEILNDSRYDLLNYEHSKIFGHKEFYLEFIKELVEEILILTEDEDKSKDFEEGESKKEKIYEWSKNKIKIILILNSLNVKIKEICENNINKNESENNKNKEKDKTVFEYNLPFILLPLFYFKGFEKFKLFLLSFIHFNQETQQFGINKNIPKIINSLLSNCKDVKIKKEEEELEFDDVKEIEPFDFKKKTVSLNKINISKLEKRFSKKYANFNPSKSSNISLAASQQIFPGTNVNIISKKQFKKTKFDLYPKEKKKLDFFNYSNFHFFWNVSGKLYSVNIKMPLITFEIPSFNIMAKQYIDFELLFYLFKNNFDTWDFYVTKYLAGFKIFRILLLQLLAIKPKKNVSFFVEKYKNKQFESTDYKIINILTSKFLTEDKKHFKESKYEKSSLLKIEEINEENTKEKKENNEGDIQQENFENKTGTEKIFFKDNNNREKKEEKQKEKENTSISNITTQKEINQKSSNNNSLLNSLNNKNANIIQKNCILEQKCFIAVVTLTDAEKAIVKQYKLHFNYSQYSKFKSMEKYMKKTSFLLKFLNIDYENSTISFNYETLNSFDEKKWMKEVEKYNLNYKSEINENSIQEFGVKKDFLINNLKYRLEFQGTKKGTSIIIDIWKPIILLRYLDKDENIYTKVIEILEEEENKLDLNNDNNSLKLSKNIYEISLEHKKKENEEKK